MVRRPTSPRDDRRPGKKKPIKKRGGRIWPMVTHEAFSKQMLDYWGAPIERPLAISRLKRASKELRYDNEVGRIFLREVESALGIERNRIRRVHWELFQEGLYQWVIRLTVTAPNLNRSLCLIVAKNAGRFSKVCRKEWELLSVLYQRNSKQVVRPFGAFEIPLDGDRPVSLVAYLTEWLHGFTELGLDKDHKFAMVGIEDVNFMNVQQSDEIRFGILELLATLFEPETGSALMDVEVNSGDFLISLSGGSPRIRLIAARLLRTGLSPAGFLRGVLRPMGAHADKDVFLHPSEPIETVEALVRGLSGALGGRSKAVAFLEKAYKKEIRSGAPCPSGHFDWPEFEMALEAIRL